MKNRLIFGSVLSLVGLLAIAGIASAHVIVTPSTAGIGSFQVFSMAVPTEKDIPTIAIRLMVPDGVEFVTPDVKPGWTVQVKTEATGQKITDDDGNLVPEMKPIEIDWTDGSIPVGERDEFEFQAQVPATPATLPWKAYQTYADGSVVAWDQTPSSKASNPYSVTNVINDLSAPKADPEKNTTADVALALSAISILVSIYLLTKKPKA